MAKNWLAQLQKSENAVVGNYNPHNHVLRTPSPSVNFAFGNGHGLPRGFTLALGGVPKGGKSILSFATAGQFHKDDPAGYVVKYDTEYREQGQLTDHQAALWGIDRSRYQAFSVNTPEGIFDHFEHDLAAICQDGMPLGLVIIDSINGIQGRRSMNAESISVQQIGDLALTLQEGFKRILPIQRKYNIGIIMTVHVRAEMDQLEQKRGNKVRMAMPFGTQHFAEYWGMIEPNRNKEGRTDLSGNEFKDDELTDVAGNSDQTAHKIRFKMKDSSCSPKGRVGEFTLDYNRGIINKHEEVFLLGTNRGVIEKPTTMTYSFRGEKWVGKQAMLDALAKNEELRQLVLDEVFRRDQPGAYDDEGAGAESEEAVI